MKINSIILGAYYSCQANNYADMKVCINTYFVNTNRNISLKPKIRKQSQWQSQLQ